MCNYVLFLPATSWNSVLYFWVVTILSGCFYTVGHIVGTVLHKWEYSGILFTIKTFQLSHWSRPSLPVVSTRELVCCYSDNLGYLSKQQKKFTLTLKGQTFILWGLRAPSLSTDGKYDVLNPLILKGNPEKAALWLFLSLPTHLT